MTTGTEATEFAPALSTLDSWVHEGIVPAAGAAIWRRGTVVAEHYAGEQSPGVPCTASTQFALASVSKPITAAAVMAAVNSGAMTLDAPLSIYVPEFGAIDPANESDAVPMIEAYRDRVTIHHLLCHVSGLPENVGVRHIRISQLPALSEFYDRMAGLPLMNPPGEVLRYSNVGYAMLALAVERATGEDFFDWLRQQVLDPFDLQDVSVKPDVEAQRNIAQVADAAGAGTESEQYNSAYWRDLAIPWGGYYGTPVQLVKFIAAFLPGHERGLPADQLESMREDHTGGVPGGVETAGIRWEHGAWGYGWEVRSDKPRHWTGTLTNPETFCHWGQSGTLVWADPVRELAFAVFGSRTVATRWPLVPPRWAELSDNVVQIADRLS